MRDALIIGGGHNGLVCAWYLARAGLKVTVLEKRSVVGGAAVTEEFHPGFRNSVAAYTVSLLNPKIIRDLDLATHGLRIVERPLANFLPLDDRRYLKVGAGRTADEVASFSRAMHTGSTPMPRSWRRRQTCCENWSCKRRRTGAKAAGRRRCPNSSRPENSATGCASYRWPASAACSTCSPSRPAISYAPNFKRAVLGRQIMSPLDLERDFGLGGDIFHGALGLDQLFSARPMLGHADYRGPVAGLYTCGAGTHPGGGVTGAPGHNAAREVLRDLGGRR